MTVKPAIPDTPCAPRARVAWRRVLGLAAVALGLALPTAAGAQSPPPPGPPPGAGRDLPAPPGTAPTFVPAGTPAAIPTGAVRPGLLDGRGARLDGRARRFSLAVACRRNGTVTVTASLPARRTIARGQLRCRGASGTAALRLSRADAARVVRAGTVPARATVRQGARAGTVEFTLRTGGNPVAPGFWTDGHLECAAPGTAVPQAYLVEPDFTTATTTAISTRAWVAWYSKATGWQWLGVRGPNAGRWDTWTATPTGIAQFHPNGAALPVPFTWGPISVPAGRGISAVGVYEIVYWTGGTPTYGWKYVNAGTTGAAAAGGGTTACTYA